MNPLRGACDLNRNGTGTRGTEYADIEDGGANYGHKPWRLPMGNLTYKDNLSGLLSMVREAWYGCLHT